MPKDLDHEFDFSPDEVAQASQPHRRPHDPIPGAEYYRGVPLGAELVYRDKKNEKRDRASIRKAIDRIRGIVSGDFNPHDTDFN
jgi:hypothetical protein